MHALACMQAATFGWFKCPNLLNASHLQFVSSPKQTRKKRMHACMHACKAVAPRVEVSCSVSVCLCLLSLLRDSEESVPPAAKCMQ